MKIKNFIEEVKDIFDLEIDKNLKKKKSLKELSKKLNQKKQKIEDRLKKKNYKKKRKELLLELSIVDLQIKKCEKIIKKLD